MNPALYAAGAVAGGLMSAAGSSKAGSAARQVAEYNAKIQERNAKVFEQQAEMRLTAQERANIRFAEQANRMVEGMAVAYRKNNVVANTGTALKVQMISAAEADDEMAYRTYNAKVGALALREQASESRLSAALTRLEGRSRQQAYKIQATQSLLGGAGQAIMKFL
ncbi:MAG: hypothetical protein ACPHAN_11785 [Pseudomonadales bacterium]|jgi:hypothetical protein